MFDEAVCYKASQQEHISPHHEGLFVRRFMSAFRLCSKVNSNEVCDVRLVIRLVQLRPLLILQWRSIAWPLSSSPTSLRACHCNWSPITVYCPSMLCKSNFRWLWLWKATRIICCCVGRAESFVQLVFSLAQLQQTLQTVLLVPNFQSFLVFSHRPCWEISSPPNCKLRIRSVLFLSFVIFLKLWAFTAKKNKNIFHEGSHDLLTTTLQLFLVPPQSLNEPSKIDWPSRSVIEACARCNGSLIPPRRSVKHPLSTSSYTRTVRIFIFFEAVFTNLTNGYPMSRHVTCVARYIF